MSFGGQESSMDLYNHNFSAECPRKSEALNKSLLVDKCMIKRRCVPTKSIILLNSLWNQTYVT